MTGFEGSRWRRALRLATVVARYGLATAVGSRLRRWPWLAAVSSPPIASEPERLRQLFERLGGSFLKFGQMLALQPDLMPKEYCEALYSLLDRVPPMEPAGVERVLEGELGHPPDQIFDRFDPAPLASASIGQVHRAVFRGQPVAVKVQRPSAARDFAGDSQWLRLLATVIQRHRLRKLEFLLEPIEEFIDWTVDELDYRREAEFMTSLGQDSQERAHQRVPRTYPELTTRRILVMEFLDGVPLIDYLRALDSDDRVTLHRLARQGFDPNRFAIHIIDNFLHQAFSKGLFHADLHPANLMILPDNVVGYLDLGITGSLSPYSRRQLAGMTLAYTRGDVEGVGEAFLHLAQVEGGSREDYLGGLAELAEDWYDRAGSTLRLRKSFTRVMLEMLQLSRDTGTWAQRDVIKYIRSSIATDGLIQRLAPSLDLGGELRKSCRRHLSAMLWRQSPSAKRVLLDSAAGARRLMTCGWRSTKLLRKLSQGELPIRAEVDESRLAGPFGLRPAPLVALLVLFLWWSRSSEASEPTRALVDGDLWVAPVVLGFVLLRTWGARWRGFP